MKTIAATNKARTIGGFFCLIRAKMGLLFPLVVILLLWQVPPHAWGQDEAPIRITAEDSSNLAIQTLLVQHHANIIEMGFSPQGTAFITGGLDNQFCVWNAEAQREAPGTLLFCTSNYIPGVTTHAWSPDEKRIAITRADGLTIDIHRVFRGLPPEEWPTTIDLSIQHNPEAPILSVQMLDGVVLVFDIYDVFTLYDVRNGDIIATFEGIEVALHPERAQFALLTLDDSLLLIDARTGTIINSLSASGIDHLVFSASGDWLATWGDTSDLWRLSAERIERVRLGPAVVDDAYFSPQDRYFVTWEGEEIRLWDTESGSLVSSIGEQEGGVLDAQFSTDMTRAVTIDSGGTGRIWDIAPDGSVERRLLLRDRMDRAYLSPDSTSLIVARIEFFARFYDVQRGQLRGRYDMPPGSEISPDWSIIAIRTNNIVSWHSLTNDPRTYAFEPFATAVDALNIRETPSTDRARIAVVLANSPVFATGRAPDNYWMQIVLADGTVGWTYNSSALRLNRPVESLPLITFEESDN